MSVKETDDFRKVYLTLSFLPEKDKISEWMSQTEYKPQKEDVKWSDDTIWRASVSHISFVAALGLCIASFKNPSLRQSQRFLIGGAASVTVLVGHKMAVSKSEEKLLALQTPMGDRYRQVHGSFESSNSKESLVLRRSKTSAGGSFYGGDMDVVTHLPRDSSTSSYSSWKEQDNLLAQEELKATVSKQQPQQLQQPHHQTQHRHHYQQQQQQQQQHYGSKDKDGLLPVWNPETEEKEGDTLDYAEEEKARRRQERREERRRKREAKELRIKIEEEERARERKSHPSYMHHHPFNERQERRARHQEMARRREREFEEEERNDSKNWS